jgi:hypothetical protein
MTIDLEALIEVEIVRRAELRLRCEEDLDYRARVLEMCERDPLYWLDNWVWTNDVRRRGKSTNIPMICRGGVFQYQREIFKLVLGIGGVRYLDPSGELWPLIVAKFRGCGFSEIFSKACIYSWQWEDGGSYGLISRKETEVDDRTDDSLFGRLRRTIRSQPKWMRPKGWRDAKRHRFLDMHMRLIHPSNGNVIVGSSTVDSAFRSRRYRRVFVDEAVAIRDLSSLLDSTSSVSNADVVGSSVKGRANHFARMWFGKAVNTTDWGSKNPRLGWLKLLITPDMDPRCTPEWHARERARRTEEGYNQEILVDFSASAPGRIWPEWDDSFVYGKAQWESEIQHLLRGAVVYEAWKLGIAPSTTAVVWAAYLPRHDLLYLLDYRIWSDEPVDRVVGDVGAAGWYCAANAEGRRPAHRVSGVAIEHDKSMQQTWARNLAKHDIVLRARKAAREESIMRIRQAIIDEKIFASPRCDEQRGSLPTLVEAIENYARRTRVSNPLDYTGPSDPVPDQGAHGALAYCLLLLGDWIWPVSRRPGTRELDQRV